MLKKVTKLIKTRLLSLLFWSVISAAFIGPGTVTTCTKAGAQFNYDMMWSIVFSTFACILLQEATARVTIFSGRNLGEAIAKHYQGKKTQYLVIILIVGAIILGSAAYETGNILGSVEGLRFIFPKVPKKIFVVIIGVLAFIALTFNSETIAKLMGAIVFFMGIAFITTAIMLKPSFPDMIIGSFVPKVPEATGSGILILGIIGTTVVPYDLFLGSGVADKKQTIIDMRFGLAVAIIIGGLISLTIITVGSALTDGMPQYAKDEIISNFNFNQISDILSLYIGQWAVYIFGFGMFAAGFSSAITAPLASTITARSLFKKEDAPESKRSAFYFKLVSTAVLLVGLTFGFIEVKPIPAIIIAQALNGLILPFITIFLVFVINNHKLMGVDKVNGWFSNILMGLVIWITLIIGAINVSKAVMKIFEKDLTNPDFFFVIVAVLSFILTFGILYKIYLNRKEIKKYHTKP